MQNNIDAEVRANHDGDEFLHRVEDIFANDDSYLVDRILPEYELHLIGGSSGAGKTTLLYQMIDEIQRGGTLFGQQCHSVNYVYASCDRSRDSVNRKLRQLGLGDLIPADRIVSLPEISLSFDAIIEALPHDVNALFIEAFGTLVPRGDTNDYVTVAKFLQHVVKTCKERRITIIGTVHSAKARVRDMIFNPRERILGSVAWGGFSETIIYIESPDQSDVRNSDRRVYLLPRNAPNETFDYCFEERGRLVPVQERLNRAILDERLDPLPPGTEITRQQALAWGAEANMSVRTVEYWLSDLFSDGMIDKKSAVCT